MVKWADSSKEKEKLNDIKTLSVNEETVIPAEKKSLKGRKPKEKLEAGEIADKLDILFNGLAGLTKVPYTFKPDDYMEEAKAVVRLSEKFSQIATAIMIFDPIIVVFGLYRKVMSIIPKKPKKTEEKKEENAEPYTPRIR